MAGPLDIAFAGADLSVRDPLIAIPRTPGERFDAEVQATMAPDRYFNQDIERANLWGDALDAYHTATGERLLNPYAKPIIPMSVSSLFGAPDQAERRNIAIEKMRLAREQYPDLPDPELIDFRIAQESRYRRQRAASYVDTGNGLSAFAGGMLAETFTPHGVASLFVPPARLAVLPAETIMGGFLRSVGREAFMQAGVGITSQAGGEIADYLARAPLGTEQTTGEIAENLLGAGVGSALFGGGLRGLHEAWRRLTPEARAAAPPSVRDAAATVERSVLDEGTSPLPAEGSWLHELIVERVQASVLRGQGADIRLPELLGDIDTPMTAVGRFLSGPEGTIDVALPQRFRELRSLSDQELEPAVREIRPASFVHLDRVDRDLAAARAQLDQIEASRLGIAYSDIVDPDTGYRLADIEARLSRSALSARERARLEDERSMILETVDRRGDLNAQLERARDAVMTDEEIARRTELQKRISDLERERMIAARDADQARQWVRERLDRIGQKAGLGGLNDALREAGLTRPELGATLARAGRNLIEDHVRREMQHLSAAYDQVLAQPMGAINDPLVKITPHDIEAVIIERGGFRGMGDVSVKGANYGLVKFIWRHGEKSGKRPEFQVTKDDLLAFPNVIRQYESFPSTKQDTRQWIVELPGADGGLRKVAFADRKFEGEPDARLVTVHVLEPGRRGADHPLSPRRADPAESPLEVPSPLRDTAAQPLSSSALGRAEPARGNIGIPPSRVEVDAILKTATAPEVTASMEAQITQMLKADPERAIQISTDDANVRTVRVADLLEEAKTQERDANVIQSCALGAPF